MREIVGPVPKFFLVGAAKSGTTSLFRYLTQHPQVFMPLKEPSFLSDKPPKKMRNLDDYLRLFARCPPGAVAGEGSTSYLPSRHAARKIQDLNPESRIAMILRNPVERAYSQYWYKVKTYGEHLSFEAALEMEPQRIQEGRPFSFHYVESGMYSEQVLRYLDTFGAERVRIFLFEDLILDAQKVCQEVFLLMGVEPDYPIRTEEVFNRSGPLKSRSFAHLLSGKFPGRPLLKRMLPGWIRKLRPALLQANVQPPPPMNPDTRERLAAAFRPDIERLESILGRDLAHWV